MLFESTGLYTERWAKREQVNLKYLSEWKDRVKELVVNGIAGLKGKFKSPKCKAVNQPDVKDTPKKLHADVILVPTDKAAYNPCTESFDDILRTHANFVNSAGLRRTRTSHICTGLQNYIRPLLNIV